MKVRNEQLVALLVKWYQEDDGIRDEMERDEREWAAIVRLGERYDELAAVGIDPYKKAS